jgi:hypothetical protein
MDAPAESRSAAEELRAVWALLNRPVVRGTALRWPTIAEISSDIRSNNYSALFEERGDVKASPKVLCANGVLCTFRIEWLPSPPEAGAGAGEGEGAAHQEYSGMFRRGEAESGLMRLSSALGDISGSLPAFAGKISQSKVFPCVAMKLFR